MKVILPSMEKDDAPYPVSLIYHLIQSWYHDRKTFFPSFFFSLSSLLFLSLLFLRRERKEKERRRKKEGEKFIVMMVVHTIESNKRGREKTFFEM